MLLVLDNGSAYINNLTRLLEKDRREFECVVPRDVGSLDVKKFDSYILSGRRINDVAANVINAQTVLHAVRDGKPLLGICYGAQISALALGGTIRRMESPRRCHDWADEIAPNPLCIGRMHVFESHMYEIANLGKEMERIGESRRCRNEIVRARGTDVYGVQFHPEMSSDGQKMISRFLELCDLYQRRTLHIS